MEKLRKTVSVLLIGVLTLCMLIFASCGDKKPTGGDGGNVLQPETVDKNVFMIGSWVSCNPYDVKSHDEQLKLLSEAGLNFSCFPYNYDVHVTTYEEWAEIDALCEKYNMFYNLSSYKYNPQALIDNHGINKLEIDITIGEQLTAAGKGKYWRGYHLWDEPFYDVLETTATWAKMYQSEDSSHPVFVNLNGGSGVNGIDNETYVRRWAELAEDTVEYIGYDAYPFCDDFTRDNVKFEYMNTYRKVANEYGLKAHAFVQSSGWNDYRMPNAEEISWDIWGYVAYGFKAVTYFNYVCPPVSAGEGFYTSLINRDGTIPDKALFDAVAETNFRVRAVGDVLMNYDCTEVYHSTADYSFAETIPSDYFLTTDTERTVISYFEPHDGKSNDLITIYNNDWQNGKTATFNVGDGIESLEWFNPETKEYAAVDVTSGSISVTLGAGEAKLFRIGGNVK